MLQHWVFYGDISDGRLEQFFCSTLKNLRRFSVQDQTNRDTLTLWNLEFRFTRQPDVDDQMWAVVAGSRDVNGSTAHFIYWCSCTLSSSVFVEIPSMLGYSATHNLRPMCPVHNRVETKAKTTLGTSPSRCSCVLFWFSTQFQTSPWAFHCTDLFIFPWCYVLLNKLLNM